MKQDGVKDAKQITPYNSIITQILYYNKVIKPLVQITF